MTNGLHTSIFENASEVRSEERIAVEDEVAMLPEKAIEGIYEIANELCHPCPRAKRL
jgi:hypothetical protein